MLQVKVGSVKLGLSSTHADLQRFLCLSAAPDVAGPQLYPEAVPGEAEVPGGPWGLPEGLSHQQPAEKDPPWGGEAWGGDHGGAAEALVPQQEIAEASGDRLPLGCIQSEGAAAIWVGAGPPVPPRLQTLGPLLQTGWRRLIPDLWPPDNICPRSVDQKLLFPVCSPQKLPGEMEDDEDYEDSQFEQNRLMFPPWRKLVVCDDFTLFLYLVCVVVFVVLQMKFVVVSHTFLCLCLPLLVTEFMFCKDVR